MKIELKSFIWSQIQEYVLEAGGSYFIFTANTSRQVIPIPTDFYDGNVKHLVITYNSLDDFEFYINGIKQEKSTTTDYFSSDGNGTFYIGRRARGNFVKGDFYEFNIYNNILDEDRILSNYHKSIKYK